MVGERVSLGLECTPVMPISSQGLQGIGAKTTAPATETDRS